MKTKLTAKDKKFVEENLHKTQAELATELGVETALVAEHVRTLVKPNGLLQFGVKHNAVTMTQSASQEGDNVKINEKGELEVKNPKRPVNKDHYKYKSHQ